jgi:Protein of unknown function (DUF3142)
MPRLTWCRVSLAALALVCATLGPTSSGPSTLSGRMRALPKRTLWVWERPEDLAGIDSATTAIAWLDQTILVSDRVVTQPRRQPFVHPSGITEIAVARIETARGASLDDAKAERVQELLLETASRPGIAALQVDFDARRSERAFYSTMLGGLRTRMPSGLPLSITALASWCSGDDWIAGLPVDEAVPMLFRMEPGWRHVPADIRQLRIREPKCQGSVGISTREPWPGNLAGQRVYVFADRGWDEDLPLLASRGLP